MWKENLPKKCPPNDALESEIEVFRLLKGSNPTEDDFICYEKIGKRYETVCKAYAISFFDSISNAVSARDKSLNSGRRNLGDYVGKYKIEKNYGKNVVARDGHISMWFYSTWELSSFTPELIIDVNAA